MTRTVAIANRHPRLRLSRRAVARAIATLDAHAAEFLGGCPPGELSLVFLSDAALARIHGDFMDDPSSTDVITFPGNPAAGLAGEICVSVDMAARFVGLRKGRPPGRPRPVGRPARQERFSLEFTLYLVHGWLHLAGYDDLQPAKKRRMRAAEARAMRLLKASGAMPEFRFK
ncbi:MAG TPA: rRNA maturation RNAse YbeY [Lacunisphaera sp.]|nr:rRNA maturation RNAse YbeY [Lacunisphaera sp.]